MNRKDLNCNEFQKVVHGCLWFGHKVCLSQVIKDTYHKGFWSDPGGKMEKGETPLEAVVREVKEETGLNIPKAWFHFKDCYIYPEREIKTFLFETPPIRPEAFNMVRNMEPAKHSDWQLFTVDEALKLKLMPSVRYHLERLNVRHFVGVSDILNFRPSKTINFRRAINARK